MYFLKLQPRLGCNSNLVDKFDQGQNQPNQIIPENIITNN